ncbi:protein vav isoform X1 [Apis mellifera caucasica]|nr:protein vav isoform X1 [Apis mellifera caucasica]
MNRIESSSDNGSGWHECVKWLTRCGALRADHKANWPEATAVDLAYTLRDGVLLCNLLNTVDPGCIDMKDVNQKPQMAQFLCLRNIKVFLSACSTIFGLTDSELFEPSMLFDLSDFLRVLRTLSALSNCPRLRRKGILGFSISHGRSQEDIYKDLQSAGAGREDEDRRRRFRRREGNEAGGGGDNEDPVEEEDGYGAYCSHAQSEEIYQDLCSLHLPPPPSVAQDGAISGGEKRDYVIQELVETERNYSDVLNSLLKYFARPLSSLLRPEDSTRIFFVEETPCDWLEDRRQLAKAREVMVDIAQYINEVKRDSDTLDIIRDIQASIIDWDVPEDTQLKDFGRLLRDGELKVKAHGDQRLKARYVFVFEQVVLICKAGRGEQYCYRETLRLDDYRLEDHTGRRTLGRDSRWSYQWLLVHKQEYTAYTLHARTEEQKQMWMKALQDAMDNVNPAACRNTNHKFKLTTFNTPRSCQRCGKFLKGRIFQGYRCEACCYAVHKQCIAHSGRCMPIPPPPPPPPSLSCERALSVKLWFVGEMGRDTASNKLEPREDGTYMLRVRPAGQPRLKHETNYALSIKADGAVKHIRVFKRDVDGADVYYLSESRFFKSVVELVEYYERASLSENFEKLDQRLLWPYRRVLAKALFDFRGGERNQLNLRRGCRVVVLSKEGDAKGWWKGKIGDQVGFFPKEYVEEE